MKRDERHEDPLAHGLPAELNAGRLDTARALLEGLVVSSPDVAAAWTLLSRAHRRLGQPLAARFCAEVAVRLDASDARARLARAEALLATPGAQEEARADLAAIEQDDDVG